MRLRLVPGLVLLLSGCIARMEPPPVPIAAAPVEVQILALNDFHGSLQPSDIRPGEQQGGAAALGAALAGARTANSITVAAGDLIGATPLESAYFLDEPAIDAMNLVGLDLAAVGNHEFDKGVRELQRMQAGGCEAVVANRTPCRLEPFAGARFRYLAANVRTAQGATLFPATALRKVGPVTLGFIGMTLRDTGRLVTPAGVAGLRFEDEAGTANALVPDLRAAGADSIVLLIHQGGRMPETYRLGDCDGLAGPILSILDRLDPAIRIVVSGHSHNAYACEVERGGARRLLTSAGKNGYFYSDIRLRFDPTTHALLSQSSANVAVATGGAQQADAAALVARYVAAAAPAAERVVGRLPGPVLKGEDNLESPLADLVADAQLAATRSADRGGAQLAFTNATGVRTSLMPRADGSVTYGQIFALQPFGNGVVVKTLTGAQLKALLEQQFASGGNVSSLLAASANFAFRYDRSRPAGQRIVSMALGSRPIAPERRYRVAMNSFLASGGDGFTVFAEGADPVDAGVDVDALAEWIRTGPAMPKTGRALDVTAQP